MCNLEVKSGTKAHCVMKWLVHVCLCERERDNVYIHVHVKLHTLIYSGEHFRLVIPNLGEVFQKGYDVQQQLL